MDQATIGERSRHRAWRAAVLAIAVAATAAVADAQVAPSQAFETMRLAEQGRTEPQRPFEALSNSAQRLRDSVVTLARAQVGRRYRLGGTSPDKGFDCSGLVRYLMTALNIEVPRTASQQSHRGRAVARDTTQLRPGDLLTFGSRNRITHIGIYVGDGKFVHASSVAGRVIESPLSRRPAKRIKPWTGARRLLADADTTR